MQHLGGEVCASAGHRTHGPSGDGIRHLLEGDIIPAPAALLPALAA
ncbi:hypothetical protein ACWGIN_27775 [Streptomyces sp. NPDC054861]